MFCWGSGVGGLFVSLSLVCGRVLRSPGRPGRAGPLQIRAAGVALIGASCPPEVTEAKTKRPTSAYLPRNTSYTSKRELSYKLLIINICLINNLI